MSEPKRIQRKRTKGFRLPPNTVSVTRPGKWGNHFRGNSVSYTAVGMYRRWLETMRDNNPEGFEIFIAPLRGKNLACWCRAEIDCHADVLLELANSKHPQ